MTLYLIGIGLHDAKDISMKGLEIVRQCDVVYLESYTSRLSCSAEELQTLYGKEVIVKERSFFEEQSQSILDEAKTKDVALLIIGSPFAATTHTGIFVEAKKQKVTVKVIENASVFSALGITGLSLYKFGRVTTIPIEHENITSPFEVFQENQKADLHTLFLLDIKKEKLLTVREALDYLIKLGLNKSTQCVGVGSLGADVPEIKVAQAAELKLVSFPQSLIIPGKLNFAEEDMLAQYAA